MKSLSADTMRLHSRRLEKSRNKQKKKVWALSQRKRESRDPITSNEQLLFPSRASCGRLRTAHTPDHTVQQSPRSSQVSDEFVLTVTAKIKLTTSIITIFAPKVPIHKEHVFFPLSTKESTEWYYIQPTINTVFHILDCLTGWRWGLVWKPLFFPGLWIFFHVATLIESLSQFSQECVGEGCVEGVFQ